MSSIHTEAFNLARRHSVRNEPDFLQESFCDDDYTSVSEHYCSQILQRNMPSNLEIPSECQRFDSFRSMLKRRESSKSSSDEDVNIAFAGMNPHETLEAMRAREHGRPHSAKILRRMTTRSKQSESSWF